MGKAAAVALRREEATVMCRSFDGSRTRAGSRINCVLHGAMQTPMVAAAQTLYGMVELEAVSVRLDAEISSGGRRG